MKTMNMIFIIFLSATIISCVSRLQRPFLSGAVVDYDKKTIENCNVGETRTDRKGKFTLKEIRYNQFILTELFHMEAPPFLIFEIIQKEGYEQKMISIFHKYGGAFHKGTKWNLDTIYLKKDPTDFHKILENK